jgi:hypothetical protein
VHNLILLQEEEEVEMTPVPTPISEEQLPSAPAEAAVRGEAADQVDLSNEAEDFYNPLADFETRAKCIPVRLSLRERKYLRLIEAILNVVEYTDRVDGAQWVNKKSRRLYQQIQDICAILSGLVVSSNYQIGQEVVQDRQYKDNALFFQQVFELGRRNKIMNPGKIYFCNFN